MRRFLGMASIAPTGSGFYPCWMPKEQQPGRNCAGSGPEAGVRGGPGQLVSATCTLFGGHPRAVGVRIRSRGGVYGTARAVEGVQN